jgi:nucleoside 2-deoxyribosyltransferase
MSNFATISIERHEKVKEVLPEEENQAFVISPVRNLSKDVIISLLNYEKKLLNQGFDKVYLPFRDTDQNQSGLGICETNRKELAKSREVHIWYQATSSGSKFDLGMVFALQKPLVIANDVKRTEVKSFAQFINDYANEE